MAKAEMQKACGWEEVKICSWPRLGLLKAVEGVRSKRVRSLVEERQSGDFASVVGIRGSCGALHAMGLNWIRGLEKTREAKATRARKAGFRVEGNLNH